MILDTSILVDIDRGTNLDKIEKLDSQNHHKISAITVSEFFTGVYMRNSKDEKGANSIISRANTIPVNEQIAKESGKLLARKRKEDLGLNINDIYIAATAIVENEPILTRDTEHFGEIKEIDVLDWEQY